MGRDWWSVAALVALFWVADANANWCPTDTDWRHHDNVCYKKVGNSAATKVNADKACAEQATAGQNIRLPVAKTKDALVFVESVGGTDEDAWLGVTRQSVDCSKWTWDDGSGTLGAPGGFLAGQDCAQEYKNGVWVWVVKGTSTPCQWTVGNVGGVDFACASTDGEKCARIVWSLRGTKDATEGEHGTYDVFDIHCDSYKANVVCAWYPSCGDGVVQDGEACDPLHDGACNSDCTINPDSWCPAGWRYHDNVCYKNVGEMNKPAADDACTALATGGRNVMLPVAKTRDALVEVEWIGGSHKDAWLGVTRQTPGCRRWTWDDTSGDVGSFLDGQDCQKEGDYWYDRDKSDSDVICDFTVGYIDGVEFECSRTDGEQCARIAWSARKETGLDVVATKGDGTYNVLDIQCDDWTAAAVCAWYPSCGDGVVQSGEDCDEGAGNSDTGTCSSTCTYTCGALEGYYCLAGTSTVAACPAGFYCAGGNAGQPVPCQAPEGNYCPAVHRVGGAADRRSSAVGTDGITCPAGYYCKGTTADKEPCTAADGFYCPQGFAPAAASVEEGLAGKPCPPNKMCAGNQTQPEPLPPICDVVQACGSSYNETCEVRQSTFYKFEDPPAWFATDGSSATCMKTADAKTDPNPQWLRVELGEATLVGTVRFASDGAATDFTVLVSGEDAAPATEANPSSGAALPEEVEACAVKSTATPGVLEAECAAAVKGQFIFIARTVSNAILEVCGVEVYGHKCLPQAQVSCPMGYQPSSCTGEQFCPGCVPCPAGTYSDKEGPYECTVCPGHALYGENPYSPEGSTSVFQCEGDAHLDGTSTLEVVEGGVTFNQTIDAWEILVDFEVARRIQINGLSTIFMSKGGDDADKTDKTFNALNFPCRVDASRAAGSDLSTGLSETVCCLQEMRQDYLMTKIFRNYTDGKDLVAANDVCDGDGSNNDGSMMLVNADLEVVGEGTIMVDTDGKSFANAITVEPVLLPDAPSRRSHESYTGVQRAKITIPDAELYKISKSAPNGEGDLTDSRELFIGLLDMLPTGTRVVDSASQQISIVLTRTQYGTFAAYGAQNIDYDFISHLNGRAHKVFDQPDDAYYAEITFVYDESLELNSSYPVDISTVTVDGDPACDAFPVSDRRTSAFESVVGMDCGPTALAWADVCPQVSMADDKVGRLYIPLSIGDAPDGSVKITFKLVLKDAEGSVAELAVALDLVVDDFVSWCDDSESDVDLTADVSPSIIIGTKSASPQRLTNFGEGEDFDTAAETLQDGLITMVLEITKNEESLEIFFEDVLVVQVNPGSSPSAQELREQAQFEPTYTYDPDSRDASLVLPPALNASCPERTFSESFFGCAHKHVLKDEEVTNKEWAYLVGSEAVPGSGAQDFMQTMLGDGTAEVVARELGRDYESYLMGTDEEMGTAKKIGLWINPGHVWGQAVHTSEYSLSEHVVVYVLYGVRSGVDGTVSRRLLQATPSSNAMVTKTLKYEVSAATLVGSVLDDVVVIEVEARLAVTADLACLPPASLREHCSKDLAAAVAPHASKIERVECVSVEVEHASCDSDGTRRAAKAARVAVVGAVVALAESADAFIDMDAIVASGSVLAITQTAGKTLPSATGQTPDGQAENTARDSPTSAAGSSSSAMVIGAAAGASAGVVVVAFVAWRAMKQCRAPAHPLSDVVAVAPAGVVAQDGAAEKARIESMLFDCERQ